MLRGTIRDSDRAWWRRCIGEKQEDTMKPIITERDEAIAGSREHTPSVRWALGSLALSMLLSALGISIANVALPTLAQAFAASFQEVQWIIIAYLLTITVMIVSVGRLGDIMDHRRTILELVSIFPWVVLICVVWHPPSLVMV